MFRSRPTDVDKRPVRGDAHTGAPDVDLVPQGEAPPGGVVGVQPGHRVPPVDHQVQVLPYRR